MYVDDLADIPDTPSWTVARRAFAGMTEYGSWRLDLVEYALDNATETQTIAGVADQGLRLTIAPLPGARPLWLAAAYDEDGRLDVAFLFDDPSTARTWAALSMVEELEFWDRDEPLPGWPIPVCLQSGA
jgi:hypothetical protein